MSQRDLLGRQIERASRAVSATRSHFRLQQRHDKLGRLVEQRAADGTHRPTVQRRYHWQHERLLGVDDARFGSVRWQLDARGQITEARYDALASLPDVDRALAHAGGMDHRESTTERFAYDALVNLAEHGGPAMPLRYAADPSVKLAERPRGRSLDEATSYGSDVGQGKLSFGFADRYPGCVDWIVIRSKEKS